MAPRVRRSLANEASRQYRSEHLSMRQGGEGHVDHHRDRRRFDDRTSACRMTAHQVAADHGGILADEGPYLSYEEANGTMLVIEQEDFD